jgi:hypothetical protein
MGFSKRCWLWKSTEFDTLKLVGLEVYWEIVFFLEKSALPNFDLFVIKDVYPLTLRLS